MKILFLIEELGGGGKERRLVELIKGLCQNIQSVDLHIALSKETIEYKEFFALPIKLHRLRDRSNAGMLVEYSRLFKKIQPDVVHAWSFKTAFFSSLLKPVHRYKFVSGFIADTFGFSKLFGFLAKHIVFKSSDMVVGNSKAGLEAYKAPAEKGRVIYNGFNPARIVSSKKNQLYELGITTQYKVVMLANVSPYKDYQAFIDLAHKVLNVRDDVTFIAIGKVFPQYKELTVPYVDNKHYRIKFLGFRSDSDELIKDCDIGILCTYTEGISNAIIELMANGVPVITNDIDGGSKELIEHKLNGVICPKDKMQDELLFLLDNHEERNSMAKMATLRIYKDFSLHTMVHGYMNIYNSIMKQDRPNKKRNYS